MQLTLFKHSGHQLDIAAEHVTTLALPHVNFETFVREVSALAIGLNRGSVVLCAAPAAITCDEIVASLATEIDRRMEKSVNSTSGSLAVVNTPSLLRQNRGASFLVEAYREASPVPVVQHRSGPQLELAYDDGLMDGSQLRLISGMIRCEPAPLFLFKNIHRLQPTHGGTGHAAEALATIVEIAERSKRTHILLGHTKTVLQWLKDPDVARSVSACVLAPYDLSNEVDAANFTAVLQAYDQVLPWKEKNTLELHASEIDEVVCGSPHLLRKWLTEALCRARGEGDEDLSWDRFYGSRPLPAERKEALRERQLSSQFQGTETSCEHPEAREVDGTDQEARSAKRPKPGIRKPNRNGEAA